MSDTKKSSANQAETDQNFIKMADVFIAEANQLCEVENPDHQLVNAALLYASARFSAFITASLSKSKENYQQSSEAAIEFYTKEFNKMLKEHIKQYEVVFDKKSNTKKK
ncbi:DUF3144 domain-containing protein [bacterium endosymbiont of Bathymodiolus sp. 5 South]|jgi:hypothetical protein|uniref:DUF3144 domain-containing protein n=1 Tax=bacterium endosymbiont of Bathymodiolus sp. 5 South TaxID=1181670 RepID=UPI0010B84EF4|nr:DUF3144 domain-containing protein [bacterium endosymbiont of Bathymodiolus sp. 5 South]CAC9460600.1 hypothetical protein [uncultured Gammaproteobacteria bacterium]CAC9660286.1 hypothetical protein [uncultured Gammaproteobacteria bacterium]SHN91528.1 hypothetical protein BCLUESOX_1919 [bacterium endosymbiont of Bathymodiolus sp. 5 South]SSC08468.1 hypothetical protein BTURTLESOX_1529 [bacterium endosymbiont of Bathymodiolus sp. 5 South]VVH55145.1 hypothetical protein BSPCLSOX_2588 [unculture